MKTFKQYLQEAEGMSRRGFLSGLASFAASAAVPAPVVKLLSTPAGVATMPISAGIALIKGVIDHLSQWDAEDDDDLFDAQEDMASDLGFEGIEPDYDDEDRGDDISATDQMFELLDLYDENPELAAAQLIKHLQSVAIDSKDIETSFKSRADDPSDWRYHDKQADTSDANADSSELANLTRLATAAQSAANARLQQSAAAATVKHMGPVQYAKDIPALPAPTKPEFDLAPDLKQKEKVPVNQRKKDDDQSIAEDAELSGILKNAGFKTSD
jgi:uncharacterized phage infection (PIP) family protein YhgE